MEVDNCDNDPSETQSATSDSADASESENGPAHTPLPFANAFCDDICEDCVRRQLIRFFVCYLLDRTKLAKPSAENLRRECEAHAYTYSAQPKPVTKTRNIVDDDHRKRNRAARRCATSMACDRAYDERAKSMLLEEKYQFCLAQQSFDAYYKGENDKKRVEPRSEEEHEYDSKTLAHFYLPSDVGEEKSKSRRNVYNLLRAPRTLSVGYVEYINSMLCLGKTSESKTRWRPVERVAIAFEESREEEARKISKFIASGKDDDGAAQHEQWNSAILRMRTYVRIVNNLQARYVRGKIEQSQFREYMNKVRSSLTDEDREYMSNMFFHLPDVSLTSNFEKLFTHAIEHVSNLHRRAVAAQRMLRHMFYIVLDRFFDNVSSLLPKMRCTKDFLESYEHSLESMVEQLQKRGEFSENPLCADLFVTLDDDERAKVCTHVAQFADSDFRASVPEPMRDRVCKEQCPGDHGLRFERHLLEILRKLCVYSDFVALLAIEAATAAHQVLCAFQPFESQNGATARYLANCSLLACNLPQLVLRREQNDFRRNLEWYTDTTLCSLQRNNPRLMGDLLEESAQAGVMIDPEHNSTYVLNYAEAYLDMPLHYALRFMQFLRDVLYNISVLRIGEMKLKQGPECIGTKFFVPNRHWGMIEYDCNNDPYERIAKLVAMRENYVPFTKKMSL